MSFPLHILSYLLLLVSNRLTRLVSITDSVIKQTTNKLNKSGCVLPDKLRVERHIPSSSVIYKQYEYKLHQFSALNICIKEILVGIDQILPVLQNTN